MEIKKGSFVRFKEDFFVYDPIDFIPQKIKNDNTYEIADISDTYFFIKFGENLIPVSKDKVEIIDQ